MKLRNSPQQYGFVSKALHWLIAVLMMALLALGWWMVDLSYYDSAYTGALSWHKSLGVCVGLLAVFKFFWRFITPVPCPQISLTAFERLSSRLAHALLFLAILLIPITGYLISSSQGAAIAVFSWFSVPALLEISEQSRDLAIDIHYYFAYFTLVLVVLHIAAALKHQFIDGTGILKRML